MKRKRITYCVWMNGNPPYVKVQYSDNSERFVYQGEKGYRSLKSAAMKKRKR